MIDPLILIGCYALIGAGIKYIDQAFDTKVFSKPFAIFLAIPTGVLMSTLIVFDLPSATIFLAVVLGVAITRKIDNIAFQLGVLTLILLPILFQEMLEFLWLPFGVLVISGIIDEHGNDWSDRIRINNLLNHAKGRPNPEPVDIRFFSRFFSTRMTMKLAVLVLVLTNFFSYVYFFAFLAFDIAYLLIEQYSFTKRVYRISKPAVA